MTMKLGDPIVAAVSDVGETRWGFHQFPNLSRLPDGRIVLTWANAADASETHGHPAPCCVSRDDIINYDPGQMLAWKREGSDVLPLDASSFLIAYSDFHSHGPRGGGI